MAHPIGCGKRALTGEQKRLWCDFKLPGAEENRMARCIECRNRRDFVVDDQVGGKMAIWLVLSIVRRGNPCNDNDVDRYYEAYVHGRFDLIERWFPPKETCHLLRTMFIDHLV